MAKQVIRRPAFQFYTADWLSSTRICLMSPAQEGAYVRLLCHCWDDLDCSLPEDDEQLARLSRLGEAWHQGEGKLVRDCFIKHPRKRGRLTHKRLLSERKKQDEWRKKCKKGGANSGITRSFSAKGTSRLVRDKFADNFEVNMNTSTSSSSSTAKRELNLGSVESPTRAREGPSPPLPDTLPDGWVDHFSVRDHWRRFHVGIDIHTQERMAYVITDRERWQKTIDDWGDNQNRPQSVGRMVKYYHELEEGLHEAGSRNGRAVGATAKQQRDIANAEGADELEQQLRDSASEALRGGRNGDLESEP